MKCFTSWNYVIDILISLWKKYPPGADTPSAPPIPVSRKTCFIVGNSNTTVLSVHQESAGVTPEVNLRQCVTHMPPWSTNKAAHSSFKPTEDITRSPKQGYQWPHKKDLCPKQRYQWPYKKDLCPKQGYQWPHKMDLCPKQWHAGSHTGSTPVLLPVHIGVGWFQFPESKQVVEL